MEKEQLSGEQKKAQQEEARKQKIELLVKLLKRNDETSWVTIKYLKMKLTAAEWKELVDSKRISQQVADKCINEYDMLKKTSAYVRSTTPTVRKNRFDGSVVEAEGKQFEADLKTFLESRKEALNKIEAAGFSFQPFWRNLNNQGKMKKEKDNPFQSGDASLPY